MANGPILHAGTSLLLVATILLLVTTISSPVVNHISFLKVTLTNTTSRRNSSVTFGALGYCVLDVATLDGSDQDSCSPTAVGYDIAGIISATTKSTYVSRALRNLTRVLVPHPIATGITSIAFVVAASSHCAGFFFSGFIAALASVITFITLVIDFSLFGGARHNVNNSGSGAIAKYGAAIWLTLAAFVVLFFATIFNCLAFTSGNCDDLDRRRR